MKKKVTKLKGKNRPGVVLSIVMTDNTFYVGYSDPLCWVGKCLHCNTLLCVSQQGSTSATIEHIVPLCDGGDPIDPHNLALACSSCNNEKGIRHDKHAGSGGRADEVIASLQKKRNDRWRDQVQTRSLT